LSQQSQTDVVKRYLLGVLPEEERDRFEERYFSDNALFDEVEMAEDELVDRYVRGELPKDDRRLFEQALSNSSRLSERVEIGRLLSSKTTPQPQPKPRVMHVAAPGFWQKLFSPQQQAFRFAFGFGVLVLLIGGGAVVTAWLNLQRQSAVLEARNSELRQQTEAATREFAQQRAANEQRAGDLQKQADDLEARRQAIQEQRASVEQPLNLIARLSLEPGSTRAPGEAPKSLTLDPDYSTLSITLALIDSDYPHYRAVVVTPDLKPISKPRTLTPKSTAAGKYLNLSIPLKGVKPGDYFVRIEGIDESGKPQPPENYSFRLNPPSK
jgi:anti-sigma factor RsiW